MTVLYPSDAELNAALATHVFGWRGVRLADNGVYVGTPPPNPSGRERAETAVPDIVGNALRRSALLEKLVSDWGLSVRFERISKRRIVAHVGTQRAQGVSAGQALCRAAWRARRGSKRDGES